MKLCCCSNCVSLSVCLSIPTAHTRFVECIKCRHLYLVVGGRGPSSKTGTPTPDEPEFQKIPPPKQVSNWEVVGWQSGRDILEYSGCVCVCVCVCVHAHASASS